MRKAVICLAVAMSLPAVIWQPRPARAAAAIDVVVAVAHLR